MTPLKKERTGKLFRQLMFEINEPVPESMIVHTYDEAVAFAEKIGFPIIVRPAYTLGGTGGGIAEEMDVFQGACARWATGKSDYSMSH